MAYFYSMNPDQPSFIIINGNGGQTNTVADTSSGDIATDSSHVNQDSTENLNGYNPYKNFQVNGNGGSNGNNPIIIAQIPPPRDYLIFSLITFVFCCLPLGFLALIFSCLSRKRYDQNRLGDSEKHGKRAKAVNVIALLLGLLFWAAIIALIVVRIVVGVKKP